MVDHSFKNGRLELRVQVVPRASKSEVVGEHNGWLRIRIAAPPVDGAANHELVKVLAKKFAVPKSAVSIIGGHSGRIKQIRIEGLKSSALELLKTNPGRS